MGGSISPREESVIDHLQSGNPIMTKLVLISMSCRSCWKGRGAWMQLDAALHIALDMEDGGQYFS